MIKSLRVNRLNGFISASLVFNPDLNVITGKNGSGKTSLLKLIWYLISGNLERIAPELSFESVELEADELFLGISKAKAGSFRFQWRLPNEHGTRETDLSRVEQATFLEPLNQRVARATGSSLFFPTFRRIEGGFSIAATPEQRPDAYYYEAISQLPMAMANLASTLSVRQHSFVASISTNDIVDLLTRRYADSSERANSLHKELTEFITERIQDYYSRRGGTERGSRGAEAILDEVRDRVERVTSRREQLLRPFYVLSDTISRIFHQRGIQITEAITLGETAGAITSDKLSSGEKQLLSFLCYNAFRRKTVVFIDEPELSLHVDWQRVLFPTLLEQQTGNQFIVATHSPFIYAKYSDKELALDSEEKRD